MGFAVMHNLMEQVNVAQQSVTSVHDIIRQQVEGLDEMSIGVERMERVARNTLLQTQTLSQQLMQLAETSPSGSNENNSARLEMSPAV